MLYSIEISDGNVDVAYSANNNGVVLFLKNVFLTAMSNILEVCNSSEKVGNDDGWSLLSWVNVSLKLSPCLLSCEIFGKLDSTSNLDKMLSILTAKQWVSYAMNYLESSSEETWMSNFVLKILKESMSMIVTLRNNDPAGIYQGRMLLYCEQNSSLLGICVAIESNLLCEEISLTAMQDETNELYSVGIFLRECVNILCSSNVVGSDSGNTGLRSFILRSNQCSQIQLLVYCLKKEYLSSVTNVDVILNAFLNKSLDDMLKSYELKHDLAAAHWAFLCYVLNELSQANSEIAVEKETILVSLLSISFLNRNSLQPRRYNIWSVMDSWSQTETIFLSKCPEALVQRFSRQVLNFLNNKLWFYRGKNLGRMFVDTDHSVVLCEQQSIENKTSDGEIGNMTSEEWSQHAYTLLSWCSQHRIFPWTMSDVVNKMAFSSLEFWAHLRNGIVSPGTDLPCCIQAIESLCYVIHCVFSLDTIWAGGGESVFGTIVTC